MTHRSHHTHFFGIVKSHFVIFALLILAIFSLSFASLYMLGLLPEEFLSGEEVPEETSLPAFLVTKNDATKPSTPSEIEELPVRVIIPSIGVNTSVANPTTRSIPALDNLLHSGAVRYPGSGFLGEGNLFIFGHSTSIKVVHNQAYKTFNGLENLHAGDEIEVRSATRKYTYRVTSVEFVNSDDAVVDLGTKKRMLTLSTCNTLGAKEERKVVLADFVGSSAL